jgi:hypothetical protein
MVNVDSLGVSNKLCTLPRHGLLGVEGCVLKDIRESLGYLMIHVVTMAIKVRVCISFNTFLFVNLNGRISRLIGVCLSPSPGEYYALCCRFVVRKLASTLFYVIVLLQS